MSSPKANTLPEYASNPFISRLPTILSQRELLSSLERLPTFDEKERGYSAALRKHCVLRLERFFAPMARQGQLAERVGMLIRQGYLGRNPLTHDYIRHLENAAERIEAGSLHAEVHDPAESTASSFALLGCSGGGKSLTINSVLRQYPQSIHHNEPFSVVQITWLKLECPTQGSPKQLCISFFAAVDRLLGTNYKKIYGGRGNSAEEMLEHMAQVAQLHALGVLAVDEIQNLKKTAIGPEALLNFLVTLINTIGIPVILIGTLGAIPLMQENFRKARRASGVGSAIWDRMPPGKEWNRFIDRLWAYQWTRQSTAISGNIYEVLYDESQGVVDIVVKLYMLAQMRMISIGDVRKDAPEVLTPELFRRVAKEDFRLVEPMLNALRNNDKKALQKFDDLAPLHEHVRRTINSAIQSPDSVEASKTRVDPVDSVGRDSDSDSDGGVAQLMLNALSALGVAEDVATLLISDLVAKNPSGDPLLLMALAAEQLSPRPVKTSAPKSSKRDKDVVLPLQDLRRIVAEGGALDRSGYEALLDIGIVRSPLLEFAA